MRICFNDITFFTKQGVMPCFRLLKFSPGNSDIITAAEEFFGKVSAVGINPVISDQSETGQGYMLEQKSEEVTVIKNHLSFNRFSVNVFVFVVFVTESNELSIYAGYFVFTKAGSF